MAVASSVHSEREGGSGGNREGRRQARGRFIEASTGGGPSHDASGARGGCGLTAAAVAGRAGGRGRLRQVGPAGSGYGRQEGSAAVAGGCAGPAAVLGWRLALGRARRASGLAAGAEEKASGPKELGHGPKIKKGGKNGFCIFFFFQIDFQKHFQIGFEFI